MRSLRMEWLERHRKVALKQRGKKRKEKRKVLFGRKLTFKGPMCNISKGLLACTEIENAFVCLYLYKLAKDK